MPSGSSTRLSDVPPRIMAIVEGARRGFLSTVDASGVPHCVPVCFVLRAEEIVTPIDHKPKTAAKLARVRHIEQNPSVAIVFDRWDEEWSRLGWAMVRGSARVEPPGEATALLRARYEQYESHPAPQAVIAIRPERVLWWTSE